MRATGYRGADNKDRACGGFKSGGFPTLVDEIAAPPAMAMELDPARRVMKLPKILGFWRALALHHLQNNQFNGILQEHYCNLERDSFGQFALSIFLSKGWCN